MCVGFCVAGIIVAMLLAYIDEIGEPGAFVSRDHSRYNTSPAFGYAGFVIDAEHARTFGAIFTNSKRTLFKTELQDVKNPGQWEKKGAAMFRPKTYESHRQYTRVFSGLVRQLRAHGGMLFYYADEKPLGTPRQTELDPVARETAAMQETLNRLCTYAERRDKNLMVMIDQINEKTRAERLPNMYGHILSRAASRSEMKRIVEPPMHVDSVLSANIQFADWVAAAVTRAIDNQLVRESPYHWVPRAWSADMAGNFTFESKVHLWHRSVDDIHHSDVFQRERRLHPITSGHRIEDVVPAGVLQKIHAATVRAHGSKGRKPSEQTPLSSA